jgi:hypothetical protein
MRLPGFRTLVLAFGLALGAAGVPAQQPPVVPAIQPDADGPNVPVEYPAIGDARSKADEILRRREFRHVEQTSWFDELMGWLNTWFSRWFDRAVGHLPHWPWFATALEWGTLALAAAGLLLWAWRTSRLQRLAIEEARTGEAQVWRKESDDWAERARIEAAREAWREAVHCLYWSAIVLLEGQKLWRQNRARTPREYVELLPPDSGKRKALGGLTRVFERIWYGLRPAAESDYRQAAAMLEELRAR